MASAGGAGNPVGTLVGGVLTGVGTTLDKSSGYVNPATTTPQSGLPELVGGLVANVGNGLNAGNTNGTVSAAGITGGAVGNTVASVGTLIGGNGVANTGATAPVAGLATNVGAALNPVTSGVAGLTQNIGTSTGIGAPQQSGDSSRRRSQRPGHQPDGRQCQPDHQRRRRYPECRRQYGRLGGWFGNRRL